MPNVPPSDLDAERAVLSAALLDQEALGVVVESLDPDDYYQPNHRIYHRALRSLSESGQPCDVVTVLNWVRTRDLTERAGGSRYLGDMLDATPAVTNVAAHCAIVKDKAQLRSVISLCQRVAGEGYTATSSSALLSALETDVLALSAHRHVGGPRPLREALSEGIRDIQQAAESDGLIGVSTGLRDLDKQLLGLRGGEVYVIAARPGMGKSALAMGMAMAGAQGGAGVGIFSLEMPDKQMAVRAICGHAGIPLHKTRGGHMFAPDWAKLTASAPVVAGLPISIDDQAAISLADLRSKARRMDSELRREHNVPLGMLVLDYIQLMSGKANNRESEVSAISRGLKELAKEMNVPVVALAQLNRKVEERKDKRPMLSDLRESGSIEQDADAVLFIYRDDYYNAGSADAGQAEIIIAKQRSGPVGTVKVLWDAETTTFKNRIEVDEWVSSSEEWEGY